MIAHQRRRIRVFHLAAKRRIARGHVDRENVGELRQVRLAQDHRAGLSQQLDNGRVSPGARALQCQRARRRRLLVAGRDIVLQQIGMPANGRLADGCVVELASDPERIWIESRARSELRPVADIGFDARE